MEAIVGLAGNEGGMCELPAAACALPIREVGSVRRTPNHSPTFQGWVSLGGWNWVPEGRLRCPTPMFPISFIAFSPRKIDAISSGGNSIRSLVFPRRRRAQERVQGADRWRNRKSCTRSLVFACHHPIGEGDAIDQGGVVALDERKPRRQFRVAGRIWCVHGGYFTAGRHDCVYPFASRASSQAQFRGRVRRIFEEARSRVRSAICVGMIDARCVAGIRGRVSGVPPARGVVFVHVYPALETPGYCRTVPPGPASVAACETCDGRASNTGVSTTDEARDKRASNEKAARRSKRSRREH